jgi:hypothetical protein
VLRKQLGGLSVECHATRLVGLGVFLPPDAGGLPLALPHGEDAGGEVDGPPAEPAEFTRRAPMTMARQASILQSMLAQAAVRVNGESSIATIRCAAG